LGARGADEVGVDVQRAPPWANVAASAGAGAAAETGAPTTLAASSQPQSQKSVRLSSGSKALETGYESPPPRQTAAPHVLDALVNLEVFICHTGRKPPAPGARRA
jgi:hypothetical protein